LHRRKKLKSYKNVKGILKMRMNLFDINNPEIWMSESKGFFMEIEKISDRKSQWKQKAHVVKD